MTMGSMISSHTVCKRACNSFLVSAGCIKDACCISLAKSFLSISRCGRVMHRRQTWWGSPNVRTMMALHVYWLAMRMITGLWCAATCKSPYECRSKNHKKPWGLRILATVASHCVIFLLYSIAAWSAVALSVMTVEPWASARHLLSSEKLWAKLEFTDSRSSSGVLSQDASDHCWPRPCSTSSTACRRSSQHMAHEAASTDSDRACATAKSSYSFTPRLVTSLSMRQILNRGTGKTGFEFGYWADSQGNVMSGQWENQLFLSCV